MTGHRKLGLLHNTMQRLCSWDHHVPCGLTRFGRIEVEQHHDVEVSVAYLNSYLQRAKKELLEE